MKVNNDWVVIIAKVATFFVLTPLIVEWLSAFEDISLSSPFFARGTSENSSIEISLIKEFFLLFPFWWYFINWGITCEIFTLGHNSCAIFDSSFCAHLSKLNKKWNLSDEGIIKNVQISVCNLFFTSVQKLSRGEILLRGEREALIHKIRREKKNFFILFYFFTQENNNEKREVFCPATLESGSDDLTLKEIWLIRRRRRWRGPFYALFKKQSQSQTAERKDFLFWG